MKALSTLGYFEHYPSLAGGLVRQTSINPYESIKKYYRSWPIGKMLEVDLDISNNKVRSNWLEAYLRSIPENAAVMAHLPYTEELSLLTRKYCKQVYISRNLVDVAISLTHYHRRPEKPFSKFLNKLDFLDACDLLIRKGISGKGRRVTPLLDRHHRSFSWSSDPHVIAIKYDNLVRKRDDDWRKIIEFLNIQYSDELADKVYEDSFRKKTDTLRELSSKDIEYRQILTEKYKFLNQ
jgi:hypothetical protein